MMQTAAQETTNFSPKKLNTRVLNKKHTSGSLTQKGSITSASMSNPPSFLSPSTLSQKNQSNVPLKTSRKTLSAIKQLKNTNQDSAVNLHTKSLSSINHSSFLTARQSVAQNNSKHLQQSRAFLHQPLLSQSSHSMTTLQLSVVQQAQPSQHQYNHTLTKQMTNSFKKNNNHFQTSTKSSQAYQRGSYNPSS